MTLLSAMFVAFVLQIFSRYVIRQPLGWTLEACLLCWLWLVFWSGAFTLKNKDHVRFSVLSDSVRPGTRRVFAIISALVIIFTFSVALQPSFEYVSFMAIEKTSLLKIRFDYLFSVWLLFCVAIIARYGWRASQAIRGRLQE